MRGGIPKLTRRERELALLSLDLNLHDRSADAVGRFGVSRRLPSEDEKCRSMPRIRDLVKKYSDPPRIRDRSTFSLHVPKKAKVKKTSIRVSRGWPLVA
jgi:hypothetical protein